jgi:hypothetical protein
MRLGCFARWHSQHNLGRGQTKVGAAEFKATADARSPQAIGWQPSTKKCVIKALTGWVPLLACRAVRRAAGPSLLDKPAVAPVKS